MTTPKIQAAADLIRESAVEFLAEKHNTSPATIYAFLAAGEGDMKRPDVAAKVMKIRTQYAELILEGVGAAVEMARQGFINLRG